MSPLPKQGGGDWVTSDRDGEGATVLGQLHANPYAVENIRQAYNNLYNPDLSSLNPNYLYVRFLPQSTGDVKLLLDEKLELWDFPLNYDIVSIGEYYHGPTITDSTYTWQYTVVPADFVFPSIQYEIIEQLAYQVYTADNSLPNPPGDLKVLITQWGGKNTGAAPMLDKFNQFNFISSSTALLAGVFGVAGPAGSIIGLPIGLWLSAAAPDIVLNLNEAGNVNSDDVREILYHELSHAIHFAQVGEDYWLDEILFTIANLGYGDGSAPGSGRAAIVEMWGYQNGYWATHLRYGLNHSNGGSNPAASTWEAVVELGKFESGYIPYGWQHDLQDNNSSGLAEGIGITDVVSGFTQAQIFATMTSSMLSPTQQKNALAPLLPPVNSQVAYTNLANAYGL